MLVKPSKEPKFCKYFEYNDFKCSPQQIHQLREQLNTEVVSFAWFRSKLISWILLRPRICPNIQNNSYVRYFCSWGGRWTSSISGTLTFHISNSLSVFILRIWLRSYQLRTFIALFFVCRLIGIFRRSLGQRKWTASTKKLK